MSSPFLTAVLATMTPKSSSPDYQFLEPVSSDSSLDNLMIPVKSMDSISFLIHREHKNQSL